MYETENLKLSQIRERAEAYSGMLYLLRSSTRLLSVARNTSLPKKKLNLFMNIKYTHI